MFKANFAYSMLSSAEHCQEVEKILNSWPEVKWKSTEFIKVENSFIDGGSDWVTCYLIVCTPSIWVHLLEAFRELGGVFMELKAEN